MKKTTGKKHSAHSKRKKSVYPTPDKTGSLTLNTADTYQEAYVKRTHKDSLFCFTFRDRNKLLQLYNSLNQSSHTNPDELIITTLENVIYLGYKNDISILLDSVLSLWEHQSSNNPNMPLRGLLYFARLLRQYVEHNQYNLFGTKQIPLPRPQYVIFYNGPDDLPDRELLRLSDAFCSPGQMASEAEIPLALECQALVLNINYGKNRELLENCSPLMEYSKFIHYIRKNISQGNSPEAALDMAVERCLNENILTDVLREHRKEVVRMFLEEYDQELHFKTLKQEGYEDGFSEGFNDGFNNGFNNGIKDGRQEGTHQINTLIRLLMHDGRTDELLRCASDPDLQAQLLKEYNINIDE